MELIHVMAKLNFLGHCGDIHVVCNSKAWCMSSACLVPILHLWYFLYFAIQLSHSL